MTQVFSYFSRPEAPLHLPEAAFFFATALGCASLALFRRAARAHEAVHVAPAPAVEQV